MMRRPVAPRNVGPVKMDKERASYNLKEVSLALPCHLVQHTMALIARSSLLSILGLRTVASRTGVLYWKLTFVRADQHIQCPCSWGGTRNSGCRKVGTSRSSVRIISKHAHSRFPAQEHSTGASKVPTIIYYDQKGNVRAIGAEATKDEISGAAFDGDWIKAEWCVSYLRYHIVSQQISVGSSCTCSQILVKARTFPTRSLLFHQTRQSSKFSPTFSNTYSDAQRPI